MAYRIKRKERVEQGHSPHPARAAAPRGQGGARRERRAGRARARRAHPAQALAGRAGADRQRGGRQGGARRPTARLRDRGRRLARPRDLVVQAHTFRILGARLSRELPAGLLERMRDVGEQLRRTLDDKAVEKELRRTARALRRLRRRLRKWRGQARPARDRQGHHAHATARPGARWRRCTPIRRPSGSTTGASRSRCCRTSSRSSARAVPELATRYLAKVERLGEMLGQIHDLDCAAATAEQHPRWFGSEADCEAVRGLVAEHRVLLEREAFALAAGVFAGRPRDVRELVETGWKTLARARAAGRRGRGRTGGMMSARARTRSLVAAVMLAASRAAAAAPPVVDVVVSRRAHAAARAGVQPRRRAALRGAVDQRRGGDRRSRGARRRAVIARKRGVRLSRRDRGAAGRGRAGGVPLRRGPAPAAARRGAATGACTTLAAGAEAGARGLAVAPGGAVAYVASPAVGGVKVVSLAAAAAWCRRAPPGLSPRALRIVPAGTLPRAGRGAAAGQQLHRSHGHRARASAPTGGSATRSQTIRTDAPVLDMIVARHAGRRCCCSRTRTGRSIARARSGRGARQRRHRAARARPAAAPGGAAVRRSGAGQAHVRQPGRARDAGHRAGGARRALTRRRSPSSARAATTCSSRRGADAGRRPRSSSVGANPSAVAALPGGRFVTADRLSDTLSFVAGGKVDGDARRRRAGAADARRPRRAAVLQPRAGPEQRRRRAAVAVHLRRVPRRRPRRRPAPPGQAQSLLLDDQELPRPGHDGAVPVDRRARHHRRRSPTTSSRRTRRGASAAPRASTSTRSRCACARAADWEQVTLSPEELRAALAAYMVRIPPEPSPYVARRRRALDRDERRGLALFRDGCAGCHQLVRRFGARAIAMPARAARSGAARGRGRADQPAAARGRDADPRRRRQQPAVAARRVGGGALLQRRQRADAGRGAAPHRSRAPTPCTRRRTPRAHRPSRPPSARRCWRSCARL